MRALMGEPASAARVAARMGALAASTVRTGMPQASPSASNQAAVPSTPTGAEPMTSRPAAWNSRTTGRVERVDRGDGGAVERSIELAPFARRHHRSGGKAERLQHAADGDRIDREHLAEQRHRRPGGLAAAGRRHGSGASFQPCIVEHRAGQNVLRLGMGRHAEARHVDADDAHAVDLLRQRPQRNAGSGGHAEIGDDDRVVKRRVGQRVHGLANILVELAGDQRFRIERHVADGALGAVEMRGEGEPVDAAGRAGKHGGGAAHAQADPQGCRRQGTWIAAGRADRGDSRCAGAASTRHCRPLPLRVRVPPCRHGSQTRSPLHAADPARRPLPRSRRRLGQDCRSGPSLQHRTRSPFREPVCCWRCWGAGSLHCADQTTS